MVGAVDGGQEWVSVKNLLNELGCCALSVKGSSTDCDRLRHGPIPRSFRARSLMRFSSSIRFSDRRW